MASVLMSKRTLDYKRVKAEEGGWGYNTDFQTRKVHNFLLFSKE